MIKVPNYLRAVLMLIFVLILVMFYESKRIGILAENMENPALRNLATSFSVEASKIKLSLRLNDFFNQEENFWAALKKSPKIFNNKVAVPLDQKSITPPPASQETIPSDFETTAPYNIVIVGDSFVAERFGAQLEKALLLYKDTKIFRKGVYSTGLSRPDYFNWNKELKELINLNNPNIAIAMFGANDAQNQTSLDGRVFKYGTKEWNEEYSKRVSGFLKILSDNKVFVFWVGNPIPRDKYYSDRMENLNSIYQSECQKLNNCYYIPTWSYLMNSQGKYADFLLNEFGKNQLARTADGIHTTDFGSQILTKNVLTEIRKKIELSEELK